MISPDSLRELLVELREKTAGGALIAVPAWWGENNADERRVYDDLKSGRLHLRSAHNAAADGLEAVDRGDFDTAKWYYDIAKSFYIAALEARMRPSDLENLGRSAAPRGRPKKDREATGQAKKRGRPRKE
jgi:hypothetical protein